MYVFVHVEGGGGRLIIDQLSGRACSEGTDRDPDEKNNSIIKNDTMLGHMAGWCECAQLQVDHKRVSGSTCRLSPQSTPFQRVKSSASSS